MAGGQGSVKEVGDPGVDFLVGGDLDRPRLAILVTYLDALVQDRSQVAELAGERDRPGESQGQAGRGGIERVRMIDGEAEEPGGSSTGSATRWSV